MREVDIWRREAALALDLSPEGALTLMTGDDIRGVTRCVKLNNYWCIKRAGWAGEIAADNEGHVAFASAREGAAVAALLLRRYYVDFNLKTARAIVSRWAPMQCGAPVLALRGAARPLSATLPGGLAARGLGNTTRARWLASHTIGGLPRLGSAPSTRNAAAGARPARVTALPTRRSVVRDVTVPLMPTPSIMVGFDAPAAPAKPATRVAMLRYPGTAMGPAPAGTAGGVGGLPSLPPLTSCASDSARLANYAAKAADGVVAGADTDLALFDEAGKPTANLAKVMANMSAVEIGPLRPSDTLVQAGVAAVAARAFPADRR